MLLLLESFFLQTVFSVYLQVAGTSKVSIDDEKLKACRTFKYHVSIVRSTGTCDRDIEINIAVDKTASKPLHGLIWNNNSSVFE